MERLILRTLVMSCALFFCACDNHEDDDTNNTDMFALSDMTDASLDMPSDVSTDISADRSTNAGNEDASRDAGDVGVDAMMDMSSMANMVDVPLTSSITRVQPMTGIVLWSDSWNDHPLKKQSGATQLEYTYVRPSDIVNDAGQYNWQAFDALLDEVAGRGHQSIVRFYYTYPGRQTAVPGHIKARSDYKETRGQTEGQTTWFPDWRVGALEQFHLEFYTEFAQRYDDDPRLAFLQVGFGLWGEYHIYDGPNTVGRHFPSKAFQTRFFAHMSATFKSLKWSISIDAGSEVYSPLSMNQSLRQLGYGLFDDSFMHKTHDEYNEQMWTLFEHNARFATQPHGGELSYYSDFDQKNALNSGGIHGRTFEAMSKKFHISYMIGNDQPNHQSDARIKGASMATGYRFEVTAFKSASNASALTVKNTGVAPFYYDAWVSVDGQRSSTSLKGLKPGTAVEVNVPRGATASSAVEIVSDRLVSGQVIEFQANLN